MWLAEGIAAGTFNAMHRYDDKVRWGSESVPDAESWGADDSTRRAMALMEAQIVMPAVGMVSDPDPPAP